MRFLLIANKTEKKGEAGDRCRPFIGKKAYVPAENPMDFGEKVKKLRSDIHLTQTQLAKRTGVSMRTIQSYESGLSYPKKREMYKRLSDALGCDQNYLLSEDEKFLTDVKDQYGAKGERQAGALIAEVSGLFSGGALNEHDMDEMMQAIQDAYWIAKKNNRKYTPGKYRKPSQEEEA